MTHRHKVVKTNVAPSEIVAAQGGYTREKDTGTVVVSCPLDYDTDAITAADIVNDDAIVVIDVDDLDLGFVMRQCRGVYPRLVKVIDEIRWNSPYSGDTQLDAWANELAQLATMLSFAAGDDHG